MNKTVDLTAHGRAVSHLRGGDWARFAVELMLIIVGILAALWIDGWMQDRAERRSENLYLQMLHRDLELMTQQLSNYAQFEQANFDSGLEVLHAVQAREDDLDANELRTKLSNMAVRKTLRLVSATYTDLTSTGNLHLIRNRELRDHILRYFAEVSRIELVLEKNNTVFVDGLYFDFLADAGITFVPQASILLREQSLQTSDSYLKGQLGAHPGAPMDEVLLAAPDAPFWEDIRRFVQLRVTVSSYGLADAASVAEQTQDLKEAIAAELN